MSGLTRIRAFPYRAPFRVPVRVGLSMVNERQGWFLGAASEVGEVWSEVAPLDGYGTDSLAQVAACLDDAMAWLRSTPLPASAADIPSSRDILPDTPSLRWAAELLLAKAAALRDGQSLGVWLGASPDAIVSLAGLHIPGDRTSDARSTVKLKVGAASVATDIEAVRRLVEGLPQDVPQCGSVRLDANRAWTAADARAFIEGVTPWADHIAFLEEPLRDPSGLADLAAWSPVPLAVDESARDGRANAPAVETGVRVLVMKPSLHGGLSEVLSELEGARAAGMDVVFSSSYETAVGLDDLARVAALFPGLPAGFGTTGLLAHDFGTGWPDAASVMPETRTPMEPSLCPVRLAAWRTPEAPAVHTDSGVMNWSTLDASVDRVVQKLEAGNIGPEAKVACLATASSDFLVLLLAAMRVGGTLLPLSPRLPDGARNALVHDAGAHWVDAPARCADAAPHPSSPGTPFPAIPGGAVLIATSGSTGAPKWIRHDWVTLCRHAREVNTHIGFGAGHSWEWSLPPHHVGGLSIPIRCAVAGASLSRTVPSRASHVSLVPTQLEAALDATRDEHSGPPYECVVLGGGPADRSLVERAVANGWPVRTSYGMTETGSMVACSGVWTPESLAAWPGHTLHAGTAIGSWTVRSDATRRLRVAGPLLGFMDTPSGPQPLGPVYETSDIGYVDDEGRVLVMGRLDRVIISGGENIDLGAVEAALMSLPGVRFARVVGIPDAMFGARPVAFVRAPDAFWYADGAADPTAHVRDALRDRLPGFMLPDRVLPEPALPDGLLKWTDDALVAIASATRPPTGP